MKFARFFLNGEEVNILAKNVTVALLNSKTKFYCPECNAEAFYRRESRLHKPCFFSLCHKNDCSLGTSDRCSVVNVYQSVNISVRNDLLNKEEKFFPAVDPKGSGENESAPVYFDENEPVLDGEIETRVVYRKDTFKDVVLAGRYSRKDVMIDDEFTVGDLFIDEENVDELRQRVVSVPKILFLEKVNPKIIGKRKQDYYFAGIVEYSNDTGKPILLNVKVHDNKLNNYAANKFFTKKAAEYIKNCDAIVVMVDRIEFVGEDDSYITLKGEINNTNWLVMKKKNGVETYRYVKQRIGQ